MEKGTINLICECGHLKENHAYGWACEVGGCFCQNFREKPCEIEPEIVVSQETRNGDDVNVYRGGYNKAPQPPIDWEEKICYEIGLYYPINSDGLNEFIDKFLPIIRTHKKIWEDEERERVIKEIENTDIDKAHTYASENAETYRTYDAGQENFKEKILQKLKGRKEIK